MKRFKDFINENIQNSNLIKDIKNYLISENEYDYDSWEDFIDKQENGECQSIVSSIIHKFPQVKKVFGEIEVDETYVDEYGEEQNLMTHHWVEIDGIPYDFSKGTLKDYIDFFDIYSVEIDDEWRYNSLY